MSANTSGNAIIGQSGGPTAVINQSLVGVIEGLRSNGHTGKIFGALNAVRGMTEKRVLDLTHTPQDVLDRVAITPSSALGSSRDKPDDAYCDRIFASLKELDIHYFFYIGGNDSSDTCRIINEKARFAGYELRCFHVPKTIDNDLMENDHTPGFGSAARFVACAFLGDNLDNAALPGIKINVIMGRHAGFLTAASALARRREGDGPHLIYVPEVAFDEVKFLEDVEKTYAKHGRCLIAVSEGIAGSDHRAVVERLSELQGHRPERDAHGNVQLSGSGALGDFLAIHIKNNLGRKLRVRADTFGYLQRCFAGCVSPSDATEAREVARVAARVALSGDLDGSIAIRRSGDRPYAVSYDRVPLTAVAAKTRVMPPAYLCGGNDVTPAFLDYVTPLVGELPITQRL